MFEAWTAHGTYFNDDSPVTAVGSYSAINPDLTSSIALSEFAVAGAGSVKSFSELTWNQTGPVPVGTVAGAASYAYLRLDDLMITGGPTNSYVPGVLNLHVSGGVGSGASATPEGTPNLSAGATTHVAFSAVWGGGPYGQGGFGGTIDTLVGSNGSNSTTTSGIFDNFDGDELVKSQEFYLLVGSPFGLTMRLDTNVQGFGTSYSNGTQIDVTALADFGNTISFATDGPVFDLPDGYTVNSVQGQIVNNRWLGGAPSSPVPEPNSLILCAIGALGLAGHNWRQRTRATKSA